MAANALVGSRLDYCNSLFRGLSVANLRKLQCIQNSLARTVCRATCLSHTTPLRKALHWLPIRHRCIFKTALLVYKYLHTNCPKYFSPFFKVRQCAYNTRLSQSDGIILHVPQRSKLGFYVPFNSQGHIGTGPQNCHLWDSNPQR